MTPNLIVLMTCYNRSDVTRACLESLSRQANRTNIIVVLVDDSSNDETRNVAGDYDFVSYVRGTGSLYWNGGMHAAWLIAKDYSFDFLLMLNDDVVLDAMAIERSIQSFDKNSASGDCIIVGATANDEGSVSYSGFEVIDRTFNFKLRRLDIADHEQVCDTFNGNFVLISKNVVQLIGFLDPRYLHSMGDIDLGLRATRNGVRCIVLAGTVGICPSNNLKLRRGWGSRSLNLIDRWRILFTHLGLPPASWFTFTRKNCGPFWFIVFLRPYVYLTGYDILLRWVRRSGEDV